VYLCTHLASRKKRAVGGSPRRSSSRGKRRRAFERSMRAREHTPFFRASRAKVMGCQLMRFVGNREGPTDVAKFFQLLVISCDADPTARSTGVATRKDFRSRRMCEGVTQAYRELTLDRRGRVADVQNLLGHHGVIA
jgi:hypothetical protein